MRGWRKRPLVCQLYRVINVADKVFVGYDLVWVGKVEEKLLFNIIYRDGKENLTYIKRFETPKYILDKDYRLFSEDKRSKLLFMKLGKGVWIRAHYAPNKRARRNFEDFNLDDFLVKGTVAKGKRVSARVVRRVAETTPKPAGESHEEEEKAPPGLFDGDKKE